MKEYEKEELNHIRRTLEYQGRTIQYNQVGARITQSEAIGARVYNSLTQTLGTGAAAALTFDTELYDTADIWEGTDHPTRFTCRHEGYYMAGGGWAHATGGTSAYRISISVLKNGTNILASQHDVTGVNTTYYLSVATGMIWLEAGDYLEITAYQASGGDKTISAATEANQAGSHGWIARIA